MVVFNLETLISLFNEISTRDREKYLCAIAAVETHVHDKEWLDGVVRNGNIFSEYLQDVKSKLIISAVKKSEATLSNINRELNEIQNVMSALMYNMENTDSVFVRNSIDSNIQGLAEKQKELLANKNKIEKYINSANNELEGMGVFE